MPWFLQFKIHLTLRQEQRFNKGSEYTEFNQQLNWLFALVVLNNIPGFFFLFLAIEVHQVSGKTKNEKQKNQTKKPHK